MKAATTMTRVVVVIDPRTPLSEAYELMRDRRIRHLPVVQDGLLLGILSDRDVFKYSTMEGSKLVTPDRPASEAMSVSPFVCEPSTHVSDIVRTMTTEKIDAMPVLGPESQLMGLVTSTDLLLLLIRYDEARPLPFDFTLEHAGRGFVATA